MDALDRNGFIELAVDSYKGAVTKYSKDQAMEALKESLIEMNGGSSKLNLKQLRRNSQMFAIIEEVLNRTVVEGLPDSLPLFNYVELNNLALGDTNRFIVKDNNLFVVSTIAEGTQAVRRQRITGAEEITVETRVYSIKIYDEINRILAGRIDFNELIDKVSKSFVKKITDDIYLAINEEFRNLPAPYNVSGSFDEEKLSTLIDHVEAATGKTAIILGSKQAVRKIKGIDAAGANSAKEDLYAMGYYGRYGNNPIIAMKNAHKRGTTDFVLGNNLYIIAAEEKFIKFVAEGDTWMGMGDPFSNQDNSQEFNITQRYGIAVLRLEEFGHYELA